jgi:tetratricopeptide (TPR) repeat protein
MPRFDHLELDQRPDDPRPPPKADGVTERDESYWLRLADQERRQGLHDNALRYYSRALELDRSLVTAWLGQVQMLVMLEEYPEAELWARKALELFRTNSELLAARAQALFRTGDAKQAQELCDAALRQEGQSAYRWIVRGELLVRGRENLDRHCFDKAVHLDPDWLVPLEIASLYLYYKLPSKALARARQAVEKAPDSALCWYRAGSCEMELGLDRQAEKSFRHCLEVSPTHLEAGRRLAEMRNRGGFLTRGLRRLLGRG